jgi:hypothetical protein
MWMHYFLICTTSSPTSWPCAGLQVKATSSLRLTGSPSVSVSSTSWDSWPDISQCCESLFPTVMEGRLWRQSGSVLCQESLSLSVLQFHKLFNICGLSQSRPWTANHALPYITFHIKFQLLPHIRWDSALAMGWTKEKSWFDSRQQ